VNSFLIGYFLPYDEYLENSKKVLVSLASVLHSTVFLGIQHGGSVSPQFYVLIVFFVIASATFISRSLLEKCGFACCRVPARWRKDTLTKIDKQVEGKTVPLRVVQAVSDEPQAEVESSKSGSKSHGSGDKDKRKPSNSVERSTSKKPNGTPSMGASPTNGLLQSPSHLVSHNTVSIAPLASPSKVDGASSHWKIASPTNADGTDSALPAAVLKLIAQEEVKLAAAAEAKARAALRANSKKACHLPPSMMEILAQLYKKHQNENGSEPNEDEWRDILRTGMDEYAEACGAYIREQRASAIIATHGDAVVSNEDEFVVDKKLLQDHVQQQLESWKDTLISLSIIEGVTEKESRSPSARAVANAVSSVLQSDEAVQSDHADLDSITLVINGLQTIDSLSEVVVQISSEVTATERLMNVVDAIQHEHQEVLEVREAERVVTAAATQVDALLSEAAHSSLNHVDESGDADAHAALAPGHVMEEGETVSAKSTSPHMHHALKALRFAAASLVAARRSAAEEAGDDGMRLHFERLYRQLLAETVEANAVKTNEKSKSEQLMIEKMARG
jgi:hypothetical protein